MRQVLHGPPGSEGTLVLWCLVVLGSLPTPSPPPLSARKNHGAEDGIPIKTE